MIQTVEKNSISSFPSYDRLHNHFFIGKNSKCQTNSTIQISSYSLKLDFSIVELQNGGNSLFSFRKRANVCLISEKRVFAHFVRQDNDGNTPLHLASKGRHSKVVSILTWDKRVDLKSLNEEGKLNSF